MVVGPQPALPPSSAAPPPARPPATCRAGLELDGHSAAEAEALLGTCCSACPGVEVLALTANIPLLLTSWLAGLRHLRCLRLASTQEVQLMWSLQG